MRDIFKKANKRTWLYPCNFIIS